MRIPVFVVTGFLDSGKTTLLNKLLNNRELLDEELLLIQFESGEEEFKSRYENCGVLRFSKKELEQNPEEISKKINSNIETYKTDVVWIEWNGVTPFSELQGLFSYAPLYKACKITKVLHMADAENLDAMIWRTGGITIEQISGCDMAVVRNCDTPGKMRHIKQMIHNLNPGVKVYDEKRKSKILNGITKSKPNPVNILCIGILLFVLAYWLIVNPLFDLTNTPVNTLINVFSGIILQAIPFLIIGILISSAIQLFISSETIERRFPKKLGAGMLVAVLFGFCLPVCDCASVPIFRSLVKKGVPVPAAITFLTATPVINPVVMLSTYYAFNGSLRIVAVRVGLGIISSVIIGLIFAFRPSKGEILLRGVDGIMCSCGGYDMTGQTNGPMGKLNLFIKHSQADFFNVGKYLMLGAFISAVFQTVGVKSLSVQSGAGFMLSLFVMILMAFLLSLCSSSDAVVARSFNSNFSSGAIMGFLVFGPMMDIKNLIMLSGGFSKKFVGKLLVATFTVCYLVVFLLARPLLGV